MNKEQQELLDEAYSNYDKEILRQRKLQKKEVERLRSQGKRVRVSLIELLTKEEFINKCKTDTEFSERWGLKIEERELTMKERFEVAGGKEYRTEIPTKLITITYNDKTIENYE
jgi:hypothetical protein